MNRSTSATELEPAKLDAAADRIMQRCAALARITDEPGCITRTFLSPAMERANEQVSRWMQEAGLDTELDIAGNLIGTSRADRDDAPVLVLGSHLDTVRDAGAYDGVLGVLMAVAGVEVLNGARLPFDLEVVAFSDEEGVRYGAPFLGSQALIGALDSVSLARRDDLGITMADAIRKWGGDPDAIRYRYTDRRTLGYLEAHIEQGPLLERQDVPLGILESICGSCWLSLRFEGRAGHAGTTPMALRRDPMPAAAAIVLEVERLARAEEKMVATVGKLCPTPGVGNVIAGSVELSLDLRHPDRERLARCLEQLLDFCRGVAVDRGLRFEHEVLHRQEGIAADPRLSTLLTEAAIATGADYERLVIGAGHDALIMARVMPTTMLFLRSPGGISHHPDERVVPADGRVGACRNGRFRAPPRPCRVGTRLDRGLARWPRVGFVVVGITRLGRRAMNRVERRALDRSAPDTGRTQGYTVVLEDGRRVPWEGLQTGPLVLTAAEVEAFCERLLGFGPDRMAERAEQVLRPAVGADAQRAALILHSTTPELRTFDGDLEALASGRPVGDFTTYKEARSVYLAAPGDTVAGRTRAWAAAVEALDVTRLGVEAITLEDADHYYLSHALLYLASQHRDGAGSATDRLIACVRDTPRVIRLYAIEREMQIFLLWLARAAGLETLAVEANRPVLSAAWNRKAVLHPTVGRALDLTGGLADATATSRLAVESAHTELARRLSLEVPTLPGYTLERAGQTVDSFVGQARTAADLLRQRYGLVRGCLKASESGDGARITPNVDLEDLAVLADLARQAHRYGDDYVLEAHVTYCRAMIAGQVLPTALSAHVRGGRVAPGTTVQFVEGTSWKGNLMLDEDDLERFAVPPALYRRLRGFVDDFVRAFAAREPGLVLAGIDFAVGTVGGAFGDQVLLGVQDLNVSFTGAECLRAFLDKARRQQDGDRIGPSGVTRIVRPAADADHMAFLRVTRGFCRGTVFADTVASIPGRWAMVGITGADPVDAIENLDRLLKALEAAGLTGDRRQATNDG